jgi:hypothetical protein
VKNIATNTKSSTPQLENIESKRKRVREREREREEV